MKTRMGAMTAIPVAASSPARYQTMKLRRVIGRPAAPAPLGCSTSVAMVLGSDPEVGFLGEIYHSPAAWLATRSCSEARICQACKTFRPRGRGGLDRGPG